MGTVALTAALLPLAATELSAAIIVPATHTTDGVFTNSAEWDVTRPTVSKTIFPRVGASGGAALYAEQGGNKLFLMYDYTAPAVNPSFFDVFFQVKNEDYLVRITGNSISSNNVFVKSANQPSNTNPDGSFNTGAPWTPLLQEDPQEFALADFHGALGFGSSPDNASSHPMAEFDLTIAQTAFIPRPPNAQPGLYDPSPAFWSASVAGSLNATVNDPPISSAIFQLSPDGTTIVAPVFGPTGGPVMQGNVMPSVPEPTSVSLLAVGLAFGVFGLRRRGKSN